uniref:Uncharacterized protein LOC104265431 n=1 Tax=Phallusia mammillata TaxID=59560 RepID=A0A6F9DJC9_9ASCI|nr:uncharacterized protein LOC104265431 [Phallusia mammillata]
MKESMKKFNFQANNAEFIQFIKLVSSLPEEWDSNYTDQQLTQSEHILNLIKDTNSVKTIYTKLQDSVARVPVKSQEFWKNKLFINFEMPWREVYINNFNSTIENRLRSFQIKLNLNAIVCNQILHSFGKIDSDLCTFCKNATENVYHVFYSCHVTRLYWENVCAWISARTRVPLTLPPVNLLFGVHNGGSGDKLVNCMLLCARYVIYQCKYSENKPTVFRFVCFLNSVRVSECHVSKKTQEKCRTPMKTQNGTMPLENMEFYPRKKSQHLYLKRLIKLKL